MNVCSDQVGPVRIRMVALPRQNGFYRNHYLTVSHALMPEVLVIRYLGEMRADALASFEECRRAAVDVQAEIFDAL